MKRLPGYLARSSWILMILLLPLTSLPLLSRVMGGTTVAMPAFIFLGIMVVVWLVPRLVSHPYLPHEANPLVLFILFALVSILLSFFLQIPSFRDIPAWRNILEGVVTLGIGVCFYLVTGLFVNTDSKLKLFVRLINYTGILIIAWSLIQVAFWYLTGGYPDSFWRFQARISTSLILYRGRATAFALEPSWLAHQLNLLYLPLWLGMSLKGASAHRIRFGKITLENILSGLGLFVLLLTFSRIGWLAFIAALAYLFFRALRTLSRRILQKIKTAHPGTAGKTALFWIAVGIWFGFFLTVVGILLIAGLVFRKLDPRMAGLFNLGLIADRGLLEWAGTMIFAERLVYWIAGFRVFQAHPFLGVGLGNAGYFFPETFNSFSYNLPEVTSLLIRDVFIPNAKSLWVRLLAETGTIGFSFFAAWLYSHWRTARQLERSKQSLQSSFGIAGQLFLLAFLVEGFSVDSFALPYYWIFMGLIVAVSRLSCAEQMIQSPSTEEKPVNSLPNK